MSLKLILMSAKFILPSHKHYYSPNFVSQFFSPFSNLEINFLISDVLKKLEQHEAECGLRYKRIEERLDEQRANFKNLDMRLWGIAVLIVVIAGLERLF